MHHFLYFFALKIKRSVSSVKINDFLIELKFNTN